MVCNWDKAAGALRPLTSRPEVETEKTTSPHPPPYALMASVGQFHLHFYHLLCLPFAEFTQSTVIIILYDIEGTVFVMETQCACCQIVSECVCVCIYI